MRKISISFIGLTMALALTVTACGDDVTVSVPTMPFSVCLQLSGVR